jgi:hypothetical protein
VSIIVYFDRVTVSHVNHFVEFKLNIYYLLNTSVQISISYYKNIRRYYRGRHAYYCVETDFVFTFD